METSKIFESSLVKQALKESIVKLNHVRRRNRHVTLIRFNFYS